jgi:hypothetical protein
MTLDTPEELVGFLESAAGKYSIITGERGYVAYLLAIESDNSRINAKINNKSLYILKEHLEVFITINDARDSHEKWETPVPHDQGGFEKSYKYLIFEDRTWTPTSQ